MASELEGRVAAYVRKNAMIPENSRILVAFSGGCDSLAMLLVLKRLAPLFKATLAAAHVNHMLRGADADADEEFCRRLCEKMGVPFLAKRGDAAALAAELRTGTEDAARTLRYRLLAEAADELGCDRIATAHTSDDNLETVLLHLIRGGGIGAVAGIPPIRGNLIRPILCLSRADTEEVCRSYGEGYVTDKSNLSDDYTRNYIRHHVVPCVKKLNPSAQDVFLKNSALARADGEYLDGLAAEHGLEEVASLADPIASRVVRRECPTELDGVKTEAVVRLAREGERGSVIALGNGVYCERTAKGIVFTKEAPPPEDFRISLARTEYAELPEGMSVRVEKTDKDRKIYNLLTSCPLNCDTIKDSLELRTPKKGDTFRRNKGSGSKPLRRVMTDLKLSQRERASLPVIADGRGVLWAYGIGRNADFAEFDPSREGVLIKIEKKGKGESKQ